MTGPRRPEARDGAWAGRFGRLTASASRYLLAYLLGIVLAVALTPAEFVLAGRGLWLAYPLLALPGVLAFVFYLDASYTFGSTLAYWSLCGLALLPVLLWSVERSRPALALGRWRPLWIATPLGFVGALGVYYTAAASI